MKVLAMACFNIFFIAKIQSGAGSWGRLCTYVRLLLLAYAWLTLYRLKTYCDIFDLQFTCLSFEEIDSLLFAFVLKKPLISQFFIQSI